MRASVRVCERERRGERERTRPVCGMEELVGGGTVDLFTYVTALLTQSALPMCIEKPLTATTGCFSPLSLKFIKLWTAKRSSSHTYTLDILLGTDQHQQQHILRA